MKNQKEIENKNPGNHKNALILRFSFPRGIILPEQFLELARFLERKANTCVTLRPFHTLEIKVSTPRPQTLNEMKESAERLMLLTRHAHTPVILPAGIDMRMGGADCVRMAEELSPLIEHADLPYYEIVKNGVLLHSSDSDQKNRYHLLHKGLKVALDPTPGHQTDLYAQDIGIVPVLKEHKIIYCRVFAGGGGGITGGSPALAGRVASPLGICKPGDVSNVVRAILEIHQEYGDKTNPRKRRLKSLIAEQGMEWFTRQLANKGIALPPDKSGHDPACPVESNTWTYIPLPASLLTRSGDDPAFLTLLQISRAWKGYYQIISTSGLYLVPARDEDKRQTPFPSEWKEENTALKERSRACRGAPGCPKGKAASASLMDSMVKEWEAILRQAGLPGYPLVFRISGCPNGCSKPYFAELALIGRKERMYDVFAGGSPGGNRLAYPIRKRVAQEELIPYFRSLLERFIAEREQDEFFGDWASRVLEPLS